MNCGRRQLAPLSLKRKDQGWSPTERSQVKGLSAINVHPVMSKPATSDGYASFHTSHEWSKCRKATELPKLKQHTLSHRVVPQACLKTPFKITVLIPEMCHLLRSFLTHLVFDLADFSSRTVNKQGLYWMSFKRSEKVMSGSITSIANRRPVTRMNDRHVVHPFRRHWKWTLQRLTDNNPETRKLPVRCLSAPAKNGNNIGFDISRTAPDSAACGSFFSKLGHTCTTSWLRVACHARLQASNSWWKKIYIKNPKMLPEEQFTPCAFPVYSLYPERNGIY